MHFLCQSCGMPLARFGLDAGRESDGSPSPDYCVLCYDNGEFLQPAIKATSMQHLVMHALQRKGWPGIGAWIATRHIPSLARWKAKRHSQGSQ